MVTISIIIPTYNRENLLIRCLTSILKQTFKDFEIIVVDDGSTDNTINVLKNYKNIKILLQENKGVSSARNRGIEISKGKYIAFCDSDDEWNKNKLKEQVEFFENNTNCYACYTNEIWIRNGVRVNQCKKHSKISGDIFEKSLELCIVSPSSVMMKKCFFDKIGLFDENLPACEDYDLWLRSSIYYNFFFIDKPLIIKYGGHEDQLSKKYWGMDRFRVKSIIKILENFNLPENKKKLALKILIQKCNILANGAEKRNNLKESDYYKKLIQKWSRHL